MLVDLPVVALKVLDDGIEVELGLESIALAEFEDFILKFLFFLIFVHIFFLFGLFLLLLLLYFLFFFVVFD